MSLFNKLKDTNLKSLKFGQTGTQGDSTEPYIVTDINNINSSTKYSLTKNDNNILKGEIIGLTNSSVVDTIRIGKFMVDPLKGPFFIAKQVGLQRSNPKIESKLGDIPSELLGGYTRLYNLGINTLSQIPLTSLGIHIPRHGTNPFLTEGKYEDIIKFNINIDNEEPNNNRLYKKYKKLFKIENDNLPYANFEENIIDSYNGGPNSLYGLGNTTINRNIYSSILENINENKEKTLNKISNTDVKYVNFSLVNLDEKNDINYRIKPITSKTIIKDSKGNETQKGIKKLMDYKTEIDIIKNQNGNEGFKSPEGFEYKSKVISKVTKDIEKLTRGKSAENFNYKIKENISNKENGLYNRNDEDILKVIFRPIDPFNGKYIDKNKIEFSGYINGYNENYTSNWDDIKYNGRAEFLYNFVSYKKTASFNLQIPIFNANDLLPTHNKLKSLQQGLAGKYNSSKRLGGIIYKISLGYYLNYQNCIINSMNIKIPDEASWDWGINIPKLDKAAYSTLIEASFNITVIGNNNQVSGFLNSNIGYTS